MTTGNIVLTALEITVAALLIVGLFNEDKLADLEEKFFAAMKRGVMKLRRRAAARRNTEMTVIRGRSTGKMAS